MDDYLLALVRRESAEMPSQTDDLAAAESAQTVDYSESWSEEDQRDLTRASLRYAEDVYPEGEDLV